MDNQSYSIDVTGVTPALQGNAISQNRNMTV